MAQRFNRVYVEIGNVCNLACSFCPGTRREPRQMTAEEFRAVAQKLRPHTDFLYLHVMGEPLFHPALGEILSECRELGFRVCITTNGTLLGQRGEELLGFADILHKVSISLHSAEGNGKAAVSPYLDGTIGFSVQAAKRGVNAVLRLWNLDSAEREGENRENADILFKLHEAFPGKWKRRYNGFRMDKQVFLEFAEIFTWPSESEAEPIDTGYCHGMLDQLAVLVDGTVVPCCLDAEGEIALGNLFHASLDEILASDRARAMAEGFSSGKFEEPLCKTCTYARRFRR